MATRFDKHINVIDSLTELLIQQGAVQFGKLADYLETLCINTAGTTNSPASTSTKRTSVLGRRCAAGPRSCMPAVRSTLPASLSGDAALGADVSAGTQRPALLDRGQRGLDGSVAVNKVAELSKGRGLNAATRSYGDSVAEASTTQSRSPGPRCSTPRRSRGWSSPPRQRWWTSRPRKKTTATVITMATPTETAQQSGAASAPKAGVFRVVGHIPDEP